jgi:uncharacterized membrane protein
MSESLTIQAFCLRNNIDPSLGSTIAHRALALMREAGCKPTKGIATRTVSVILRRTRSVVDHTTKQEVNAYPESVLAQALADTVLAREQEGRAALATYEKAKSRLRTAILRARALGHVLPVETSLWDEPTTPQMPLPLEAEGVAEDGAQDTSPAV